MLILTAHWDWQLLWTTLTITAKLYIVFLSIGAAYSTYFLVCIASCVRRFVKRSSSTNESEKRPRLREMAARLQTLRQFHVLIFFLFGVCCANEAFATLESIRYSSMSLSAARITVFEPVTAFAFVVLAVLLFLHAVEWAAAHALQKVLVID